MPRDQVIPHTDNGTPGSRFGFAYAVNTRLVVRGGYGLSCRVAVGHNLSNAGTEPPFFTNLDILREFDAHNVVSRGFPTGGA